MSRAKTAKLDRHAIGPKPHGEKEDLVPGVPMRTVLRFLCWQARVFQIVEEPLHERDRPDDRFTDFEAKVVFRADFDAVLDELVSRGWIEPAISKQPTAKRRFRVTEAGQRLARESADLFKWPAARSEISPAPQYGNSFACLVHLHSELARLGRTPDSLARHQRAILSDLETGLDEEALASMHDWWTYKLKALAERSHNRVRPAKPRIELGVYINGKGNLVVEWQPAGLVLLSSMEDCDCDWARWSAERHRHVDWTSRPSNELLFIREFDHACRHFPGLYDEDRWGPPPDSVMIDSILLQATAVLVRQLRMRLNYSFEVRMITEIETTFEHGKSKRWRSDEHSSVLSTWRIVNVEARKERLEKAELERFPADVGFPLGVLIKALIDAGVTSPSPAHDDTTTERAARALKKAGHKITLGQAKRYREVLQRWRPHLFPMTPPAAPLAIPSGQVGPAQVLAFRRPNGSDEPKGNGAA